MLERALLGGVSQRRSDVGAAGFGAWKILLRGMVGELSGPLMV